MNRGKRSPPALGQSIGQEGIKRPSCHSAQLRIFSAKIRRERRLEGFGGSRSKSSATVITASTASSSAVVISGSEREKTNYLLPRLSHRRDRRFLHNILANHGPHSVVQEQLPLHAQDPRLYGSNDRRYPRGDFKLPIDAKRFFVTSDAS